MKSGYTAGGNIKPRRFVQLKDNGSGAMVVVHADSNSSTLGIRPPQGVSGPAVRYAPGTPWNDGYVATATAGRESCLVYDEIGQVVEIEIGDTSADQTIAVGDLLAPATDATGRAVKASSLVSGAAAVTGGTGTTPNITSALAAGLAAAGNVAYYGAVALQACTTTAGADGTAVPVWILAEIRTGIVVP